MQARCTYPKVGRPVPHLPPSRLIHFVLPRPETAASVTHLVERLTAQLGKQQPPSQLRVLDFCTGTGCIPLLFHDEFYKSPNVSDVQLDITGYDISKNALSLAHENLAMQMDQPANRTLQNGKISARHESLRKIRFLRYDVLGQDIECTQTEAVAGNRGFQRSPSDSASARLSSSLPDKCDVLVSNPPYISPSDYMRTTARSVRHFEPKLALVPLSTAFAQHVDHENLGELFYPRLLDLAEELSAKVVLLEVADLEQASRVVKLLAQRPSWSVDVEIWRDEPSRHHEQNILSGGRSLRIIGEGSGRSVFIWRKDYCARRCLL